MYTFIDLREGLKMDRLYYCAKCMRILESDKECSYCKGEDIESLSVGAPVSVIENKLKGKVLKIKGNEARLLVKTESGEKLIKDYSADKLRKVL